MPIFLLALIGLCAWGVGRASASSHPTSPPPQLTAPAPVVASGRGGWSHHVMPQHHGYAAGYAAHYPQHHEYRGGAHLALPPGTPQPMLVFRDYLNAGQRPPNNVVLCAIAQAEVEGDYDLRDQIYRAFVNPNGVPSGGANAPAPAADAGDPDAGVREALAATGMEPDAVEREVERIKRERAQATPAAPAANDVAASPPATDDGTAPDVISGMELGAMDLGHAGPGRRMASPIAGVDGTRWGAFVDRVEREAPTFANDKHVGRFRARRERLRSLGLDPNVVASSTEAQLDALEKEMSYALHHLRESGMTSHVGEVFLVPAAPGDDSPPRKVTATLSGLLGLVQAAGLEGACEWLERPRDRQRFPHTTAAFLRTNGCF